MLAPVVIGPGVVHAPVRARERLLAFDKRVTQLVKDHLGEAVVGIERLVITDRERAAAIGGRVRVGRAHDREANATRGPYPHLCKWIDVPICDHAWHALTASTKTCGCDQRFLKVET